MIKQMGSVSTPPRFINVYRTERPGEKDSSTLARKPVRRCQRALHKSFGNDSSGHKVAVSVPNTSLSNNPDCSLCKDWGHGRASKVASTFCHVCSIYLCGACAKKHKSVYNEQHFISSVSLTVSQSENQARMVNGYHTVVCKAEGHRDIPKYFCETCEDIVCLECIENHHKRHHFLYAKDAYAKHKIILEQYIHQARGEAFRISKQIEHEDSVLNDLIAEKNDIAKKVRNHTAILVEALHTQEAQLLTDLEKMYTLKEEIVSKNKERCQNHLELINRTCRFTEKAINDASELQVLVFKRYAMKRLEELSRPEILTTDTDNVNLNYFVAKKSPDHAKRLLGKLVDTTINPSHCVAHGDGLVRAIVGQEACFVVTAKDKKDVPLTTGGDDVQVSVSSTQEEVILARVLDQGDGIYTVTYTPRLSGKVTISVRIYDQPIGESEFKADAICQRDYNKITDHVLAIEGLSPPSENKRFKLPCGVAVDGKGRIFIADCHNHCIKITSREGKPIGSFGSFGNKNGQLNNPTDVTISRGKVYVCDKDNNRIQCFTPDGVFLSKFCFGSRKLKRPWGLCIDIKDNIVVADTKNNCLQVFAEDGRFLKSFGIEGSQNGEFLQPYFAAVHTNGNIYITDNGNHRVQVFDADYSYLFQFGNDDSQLSLKNPTGITIDHQGHVIVADQCNSRLQVFRADGSRVAVILDPLNDPQCPSYPKGLAVTQDGYIVVADSDNDRVLVL